VTDPCNYANAFWNGAAYLESTESVPMLYRLFSVIFVMVFVVTALYLYHKCGGKKESR
jgi:hypothetical protein